MEFIPPIQQPTGLAQEVIRLTQQQQAIQPGLAIVDALKNIALGGIGGLQKRKEKQLELAKEQRERFSPVDEIIRQSAKTLGYTIPQEQAQIDRKLAESIVEGATKLKVAETRIQVWKDRIATAAKEKNLELLRKYRDDIVGDFNLTPEQKSVILRDIDAIFKGKEIGPRKKELGIPERPAIEQQGLPGLEIIQPK